MWGIAVGNFKDRSKRHRVIVIEYFYGENHRAQGDFTCICRVIIFRGDNGNYRGNSRQEISDSLENHMSHS